MTSKFKCLVLFALCAACALPAAARAQEGFQADQFEPAYDQQSNILNTYGSDVIEATGAVDFSGGVFYHYAHRPLRVLNLDTNESIDVISAQHKIEPWVGFGFFNVFDIGVVVPLVLANPGEAPNGLSDNIRSFSIGDVRVVPKIRILDREKFGGFGLAVAAPLYMPTGDKGSYTSQGVFRAEPRLILDYTFPFGLSFAANIAYQFRDEQVVSNYVTDNILRWSFAALVPLGSEDLSLVASVFGDAKFKDNVNPRTGEADTKSNFPIEAVGALRYNPIWGLQTQVGGGAAVTSGVGAPEFRVLASVGYQHLDGDEDGDGILDSVDQCPTTPGLPEFNGCPNPDTDGDGILDVDDKCVNEPGIPELQGCPPEDSDKDGIYNHLDKCPNLPGLAEFDGCPNPDSDGDGVCDPWVAKNGFSDAFASVCKGSDLCPDDPEDKDGFEDDDGCPDPDNDNDGICDPWVFQQGKLAMYAKVCRGTDKCPDQPEVINGFEDDDGCPDEGKPAIVMTDDKIELEEQIFFDTGKATIKPISFPVLDQVASVMQNTPRIIRIRVEGHTDDVGKPDKNLQLSKDRAASVMAYLVRKGIDPARLSSEGFGQNDPLVPTKGLKGKDLNDARAKNRRVEIKILELAPKK
jgi:outer membrane protein OmpA-like peptidoglycan-associated protein